MAKSPSLRKATSLSIVSRSDDETYLSVADSAKFAGGISSATVRRFLTQGLLKRYKCGPGRNARTLVCLADLKKLIRPAA